MRMPVSSSCIRLPQINRDILNRVAIRIQDLPLDDDGIPFRHSLFALYLCQIKILVLLSQNGLERSLGLWWSGV